MGREGGGGEVGVVHEGDVGLQVCAGCEVELKMGKGCQLLLWWICWRGGQRGEHGTGRTKRAFCRHWITSGGNVFETWRFVWPAEGS